MATSQDTSAMGTDPQKSLKGEIVYIRAFDLAYDTKRLQIERILGQDVQECSVGPSKPGPKQAFFYRPQMVTLPARTYQSSLGPVEVSPTVKVFNVGAVSIQVRIPFEVAEIGDLVDYYGLELGGRRV